MKLTIDESIIILEKALNKIVSFDGGKSKTDFILDIVDEYKQLLHNEASTFIKDLEKLIKNDCDCCGDIKESGWLECGCETDGKNKGIKAAIKLYKKHYDGKHKT